MLKNEKMCRSKRLYWSEGAARSVADRATAKRGVALRVYKCPYCFQYHLTSKV